MTQSHSFLNLKSALVFVLLLGFSFSAKCQNTEPLTFPGTNIQIELPVEYATTTDGGFSGIVDTDNGIQFVASSFMAPISIIKSQLTPEAFAVKNVEVIESEDIEIDGLSAILHTATQTQDGLTVNKLILIFGTESSSNMIMVVYGDSSSKDQMVSYLKSIKLQN